MATSLVEHLTCDAVVVGGGPNGLVAACLLADAGWDVCLFESQPEVGGAVASVERTPGFISDSFSAFYPLAAASPIIQGLGLDGHGLTWRRAPAACAHVPAPTASKAAVLYADPVDTAAGLDADHPGDGQRWLDLLDEWRAVREPLLECLFSPFPPVAAVTKLLARLGPAQALRLARTFVLPVDTMTKELFGGSSARLLFGGNAMHADVPSVAPGSGAFGWILAMLAQDVGFPVPEGGAARFAQALRSRAEAAGAQILVAEPVERIAVAGGRAVGVITKAGRRVRARRAVLADVGVPALYQRLLPRASVPARLQAEIERCFEWDLPTVKVNWTLRGRVPWRAAGAELAGTVHIGVDMDQIALWSAALTSGQASPHVFQLVGQLAAADPTRAPAGCETVWAYSHLPRGVWDRRAGAVLADRMAGELEAHAPGFTDLVIDRWDQLPGDLEEADANLVGGAVNGGTAQIFQQLVFRPTTGLGRPETPVAGLYLASAGASPGGGVHGACGAIAARAALAGGRLGGLPRRGLVAATRYFAR